MLLLGRLLLDQIDLILEDEDVLQPARVPHLGPQVRVHTPTSHICVIVI